MTNVIDFDSRRKGTETKPTIKPEPSKYVIQSARYILSSNPELVASIVKGLNRNEGKYGKRYCPCKIDKIATNVCPCKEYRETGFCHCGLFIK